MSQNIINFTEERLIRRAPLWPLAMSAEDFAYIDTCLEAVDRVFAPGPSGPARPDVPLRLLPAQTLMRRLATLRRELRPANAEQRLAHGMLWGALGLLNTARAMADEKAAAGLCPAGHK